MGSQRTCPDCGATLLADAPRGLCPQCLLGAAFSPPPSGESDATAAREAAGPGVLDTIALSIGPVPRVLLRDTAPGEAPGPIVRADGNGADAGRPQRSRRRSAPLAVHLRSHRPDDGLRAYPGSNPPRPQALQRDGRQLRRGPGDGLGTGQGA